jgi:hypothetical protein
MLLRIASLVVLSVSACLHAETLGVYLDNPLPEPAAASFREELRNLLKETGVSIELRSLKDRRAGESFDRLLVVELSGSCDVFDEAAPLKKRSPLASTQAEGNRILPYTELFCGRIRGLLAAALEREPLYRRHTLLGRALARVLGHEIYHFLAQEKTHALSGVAKDCLAGHDLLGESFAFDRHTLARLRATPERPVYYEAEEATGR